jgi:hypothetical protein
MIYSKAKRIKMIATAIIPGILMVGAGTVLVWETKCRGE